MTIPNPEDPEAAYPVPFKLSRIGKELLVLRNISAEPVRNIRLSLIGPGVFSSDNSGGLEPSQALNIVVGAGVRAVDSLLIVRWFRSDGREYLWQISF